MGGHGGKWYYNINSLRCVHSTRFLFNNLQRSPEFLKKHSVFGNSSESVLEKKIINHPSTPRSFSVEAVKEETKAGELRSSKRTIYQCRFINPSI